MKQIISNNTMKNLFYGIVGLAGINLIIFIHEMGHWLFANLFHVPTPLFSLGFGPILFAYPLGQTTFTLSLLPFGGYVQMDPEALGHLAYIPHMLILFAGILFNLIFAGLIFLFYSLQKKIPQLVRLLRNVRQPSSDQNENKQNNIIGPIGIIALIGKSLAINPQLFWFILAILSLNIALFNILPLPFFDGGQALICTIQAITGKVIPETILWIISTVCLALFILMVTRITMNDLKQLFKK